MAEITDRITITGNQYNYDRINQASESIKRARMSVEKIDAIKNNLVNTNDKPAVVVQEKREEVGTMNIMDNVEVKGFDSIGEVSGTGKYYNAIKSSKEEAIRSAAEKKVLSTVAFSVDENSNPSVVPSNEAAEVNDEVSVTTRIRKGGGKIKGIEEGKNYVDFLGNREDAEKIKADTNEIFQRAGLGSDVTTPKVEIPTPVVEENKENVTPRYSNSSVFEKIEKTPIENSNKNDVTVDMNNKITTLVEPIQNKKEEKNDLVNKINDNDEREKEILQKARTIVKHEGKKSLLDEYRQLSKQISDAQKIYVEKQEGKMKIEQEQNELTNKYNEKQREVEIMENKAHDMLEKQKSILTSLNGDISKVDEDSLALTRNIDEIVRSIKQLEGEEESYRAIIDEGNNSLEEVERTRGRVA